MPVKSLFDEDHLVPIALVGPTLFTFSQLDGCLYRISGQGQAGTGTYEAVSLSGLSAPFCVPGHPFVYDLGHASATLTVRQFPLAAMGLGQPLGRNFPSPPRQTHRVAGLIPNAEKATPCVVFEPLEEADETLLMDIRCGRLWPATSAHGAPKCILNDGTLAAESESGWSLVRNGKRVRHGDGSIVAVASEFIAIKRSNKSGAWFSIIRSTCEAELPAPTGWSLISFGASDTRITAYGIHAEKGQRLLQMDPADEHFRIPGTHCGTSQVFSMGAGVDPVIRSTGLAIGSSWQTPHGVIAGIAAERSDLSVRHITPVGLPCIYVRSQQSRCQELVVCLHGGPDSHELDDLRYGGTYRTVLDAGFDLLIINYPGSAGFGSAFQERAWHNWPAAIRETAGAVAEIMDSYGTSIVSILGVSFGAWMGLQLAERVHASQVVAMSPIFDLQSHLQLHSDDPEFRRWAADRFALTAESPDDGEQHIGNFTGRVVVIAPVDDEVVVPGSTLHSTNSATRLGREWSLVSVPGNHYPKASAAAEQRWAALEDAIAVRPGTRRFSASPRVPGDSERGPLCLRPVSLPYVPDI